MVGRDEADGHDVVGGRDHGVRCHRDDRIEIARGERVGEVARIVGEKGVNERKVCP